MTKTLKNNKKGFTLTELIIVIVIIGILAAVLIPSLSNYIQKAKKSAAEQNAMTLYKEKLAGLDVNSDEDLAMYEGDFAVEVDGYVVYIEDGALKESVKTSISALDKKTATEYASLDTDAKGKYRTNSYYILYKTGACETETYYLLSETE